MNIITEAIKKNRPSLSESSVKTYTSILRNLHKRAFDNKEVTLKDFDDVNTIKQNLKDTNIYSRKTILSALFVITKNAEYQEMMMKDADKYNKEQNEQVKTESQKVNWIDQNEVHRTFKEYETKVKMLLKLDRPLDKKEMQYYQSFIIICLTSGIFIPPRRLKDWSEFKIKNIDMDKDNYLESKKTSSQFFFNNYKTNKFYGKQSVKVPNELHKILKQYLSYVKEDYLLNDSFGKKLTPVKLNQRLCKIFGKNVSVNILRHSFLTEKYKEVPAITEMNQIAKDMGHNVGQALLYVKKD
jgi:hypothetical protein